MKIVNPNETAFTIDVELKILDKTFTLKNTDVKLFQKNKQELIELFMEKIDWYQVDTYDVVEIENKYYVLSKRSRDKLTLIGSND